MGLKLSPIFFTLEIITPSKEKILLLFFEIKIEKSKSLLYFVTQSSFI
jgi:hypothetical protein